MIDFMDNEFRINDIHLSDEQLNKFIKYYEMLIEMNKVMNLTTITDFEEVVIKHFVDSISVMRVLDLNGCIDIIDVGTGAGFPGIPLKIVFPDLNITLLDSLNKRVKFLNDVIDELELNCQLKDQSIIAVHGRAEDFGQDISYREKFDLCLSRAVANLTTLCEYCLPFVKKGGSFVAYKAANIDEEVLQAKRSVKVLGGIVSKIECFQLSNTDIKRSLIKIDKKASTPKKYPRTSGKPQREPII